MTPPASSPQGRTKPGTAGAQVSHAKLQYIIFIWLRHFVGAIFAIFKTDS